MHYKESKEKSNKLLKNHTEINIYEIKNIQIPKELNETYRLFFEKLTEFEGRKPTNQNYLSIIVDSYIQGLILEELLTEELLKEEFIKQEKEKSKWEIIDIGTGLGIPSIPIILYLKKTKKEIEFYLMEPKQKKVKFLENIKKEFNLEFEIINSDEKSFYSKNRKKFDVVFCRAVFTPPKIFDIFKKFSKNLSFWQYSNSYEEILKKYHNKIKQNNLEIYKIFKYTLISTHFTIVFKNKYLQDAN